MTKNEFKSWFDGFCEGMEGAPNEKQWERIKARVAEINDVATTYPVFIDRYVAPYKPHWPSVPYWGVSSGGVSLNNPSAADYMHSACDRPKAFDLIPNMKAAGSAEYHASLAS